MIKSFETDHFKRTVDHTVKRITEHEDINGRLKYVQVIWWDNKMTRYYDVKSITWQLPKDEVK